MDKFRKREVEDLSDFRELQGKEMSTEDAMELAEAQRAFAVGALNEGFREYDACMEGEINGFFGERVAQVIDDYHGNMKGVEEGEKSRRYEAMAGNIVMAYQDYVYDERGDRVLMDKEKFFLEFLLGLRSVELNVRIALETVKKMAELDEKGEYFSAEDKEKLLSLKLEASTNDVVEDVKKSSEVAFVLGNEMQRIFGHDPEGFWLKVTDALRVDPFLEMAARKVVSMRTIPEQVDMVGMAQTMHWSGWGGSGDFLKQVSKLDDPALLRHVIAWHGDANAEAPHFSQRMALFGAMISKLKEREAKNVVPLLLESFPDETELKVFDAGCGPVVKGSANWIGRALAEAGKKVSITAGEVDGTSLAQLAALKGQEESPVLPNGVSIEKVVRYDVNQDWPNIEKDKYHLFVMSIVLHQVMDFADGHDTVADILSRATQATKTGGVIAWSDAGEHAFIQSSVIPFNVSDREGGVPENIYSRIAFDDVAVFTERRDGHCYYKVPYRASWLRYATPESVAEKYGTGIYESNVFIVLELPEYLVNQLDSVRKDPQACDQLLRNYYNGMSSDDVRAIGDGVSLAVRKQMN